MTGKQLRSRRVRMGYTIADLAKLMGVSWITVWRKEQDQTGIPYLYAEAMKRIPKNPNRKRREKKAA